MIFLGGANCVNPYKGGFNTQATSRPPSNRSTKFNLCYNLEWYFYTGKKVKEKGERRTDYVLTVRQDLFSSRLVYTLLSVHSSAIADTQPDHSSRMGVCKKGCDSADEAVMRRIMSPNQLPPAAGLPRGCRKTFREAGESRIQRQKSPFREMSQKGLESVDVKLLQEEAGLATVTSLGSARTV